MGLDGQTNGFLTAIKPFVKFHLIQIAKRLLSLFYLFMRTNEGSVSCKELPP